jgi:hypothetical protein
VTVVELCHRLDGLPLALELAAVRTRALGVEEIVTRLKDRFDLLVGGSRSALPRQQTLRAAIDWSYDLLPPNEQALFRKLAVFVGDFDLEAVEAICSSSQPTNEAPVNLLSSLVEKSLVNRVGTNVRARFRLNETIQKYALEFRTDELDRQVPAEHSHFPIDLAAVEPLDELATSDTAPAVVRGATDLMVAQHGRDPIARPYGRRQFLTQRRRGKTGAPSELAHRHASTIAYSAVGSRVLLGVRCVRLAAWQARVATSWEFCAVRPPNAHERCH